MTHRRSRRSRASATGSCRHHACATGDARSADGSASPCSSSRWPRCWLVGGSLWFALRDLHRDATIGSLTELTVPYATAARARLPDGLFRAGGRNNEGDFIERFRDPATSVDLELAAFRESFKADVAEADVSVIFTLGQNSYILNAEEGAPSTLAEVPEVTSELVRGQVATGTTKIEGVGEVLYATTPIIGPGRNPSAPFLMLTRPDESARQATADLVRALTIAGLLLVVIGIPLALGLSRSVTARCVVSPTPPGTWPRARCPSPCPSAGRARSPRPARRSTPWPVRSVRLARPSASCWPTSDTTCAHH